MELFVNDKSCGKKNVENCLAVFDVVLPFGSSTLEAKGFGEKLTGDAGRKDGNTEDVMNIWYNPLPDQAYKAGSWGYIGGENKSTTSEIQNTIDGPIYQIWRKGDLEYKIDAPKGEYQVELLMADVTKPATQLPNLLARSNGEASSKDARFDVSINGEIKETDFTPIDGRPLLHSLQAQVDADTQIGFLQVLDLNLRPRSDPTIEGAVFYLYIC